MWIVFERPTLKLFEGGGKKASQVLAEIKTVLFNLSDTFGEGGTGVGEDPLIFGGFSALALAWAMATVSPHLSGLVGAAPAAMVSSFSFVLCVTFYNLLLLSVLSCQPGPIITKLPFLGLVYKFMRTKSPRREAKIFEQWNVKPTSQDRRISIPVNRGIIIPTGNS